MHQHLKADYSALYKQLAQEQLKAGMEFSSVLTDSELNEKWTREDALRNPEEVEREAALIEDVAGCIARRESRMNIPAAT